MSQHIYRTAARGGSVSVTLGYDRPLDYVFCTVIDDDDGEVLYSNLDDSKAGLVQQEVAYYRAVLARLGISAPEAMYTAVREGQLTRRGNKLVLYGSNGGAREQMRGLSLTTAPSSKERS